MSDVFDFYVYDDRSIQYVLAEPIMLEDKDVTQFRFRIPKSLNGFDMSDWEWWFVFVNPKGTKYTTLLELTDDEDEPDEYSVATYTVGYGFSGIVGTVRFSIEALNVSGEEIVNEWHTKTYSTAVIDTLQGLRAVIPEPEGQAASGLTQQEKELILTLFSKAAYADDDAKLSYDQLEALWRVISRLVSLNLSHVTSSNTSASVENGSRYVTTLTADTNYSINSVTVTMGGVDVTATYYNSGTITIPRVNGDIVITATAVLEVSSLSAVYTQSKTVYDTDSLDSLKSDLVVTATYPDSSTVVVDSANYNLSGTLTEGTSVVTVSYGGKTATFNVTVSHSAVPSGYTAYDYIYKSTSGDIKPIVTDAQLTSDYTVEMRYKYPSGTYANPFSLFGTKSQQWGGSKEIALFITQSTGKLGYWYANTDTKNEIFISADTVHSIKVLPVGKSTTYPSNAVIDVDGTEYDTGSTASGETWSAWFGIFGYAYSATNTVAGADFSQIGEIIIKDANDDIVYDFVPVSRNDNKNGFYEAVNGTFYEATSMTVGNWE